MQKEKTPEQKARKAVARRAEYARNREREMAASRAWAESHKERKVVANRAWYERNRERKAATARAWYECNKERIAAVRRAERAARGISVRAIGAAVLTAEERAAYNRAWRERDPERARLLGLVAKHIERAKKFGVEGRFAWRDIKHLQEAQQSKCAAPHCATSLSDSCTVDHIMPLKRGGSNWPENIQLLCWRCNRRKGNRTMSEWLCEAVAA
jgi:5-methylcytosine-specific restriction endonuclease McrA